MGNIRLYGSTSGYTELAPPAVAPDGVLSLPSGVGTLLTAEGTKVLQIVRATDGTSRTTTSATFVDANISVTITPQKSTSAILLFWAAETSLINAGGYFVAQITDNSNNQIAGPAFIGNNAAGFFNYSTLIAYDTPSTTSATTYKGRFRIGTGGTAQLNGNGYVGQLFAIEVSA